MKKTSISLIKVALICFLIALAPLASLAQKNLVVSGTVADVNGKGLEGVTVSEKNSGRKTLSNAKGFYTIRLSTEDAELVFTHVGMAEVAERVSGRNIINITLQETTGKLDDVVVIGYGTVRKKDVTASVSSVPKEALTNRTLFSLADAMKGKAAGIQITQNDGTPGSENTIRIRGASSISGGSSPLYVIDGVIQENGNSINPGDIESIEILKDASGTAMYGARGANGVILITTKTGKAGKPRLELYSNTAYQEPGHLFQVMNAKEYAHARFLASAYTYSPASAGNPDVPASVLTGYTYYRDSPLGEKGGFWGVAEDQTYHDWEKYASPDSINTDWQKAMFQNSLLQEYRLNVSGGTKDTRYSFMGGYLDQGGLVVYSGYKRYNARFNFQQKLSNAFTLNSNIAYTRTETDGYITGSMNGGIASNAVITAMLNKPPVEPLTQSDVEDNADVAGYITTNPYTLAKYVTNERSTNEWLTRLALDWNISKNIMFRITGNYSSVNTNTDAYYPKFTQSGSKFKGRGLISRGATTKMMNENLLYYKGRAGDHSVNVVAGATFEQNKLNLITAENQNYDIELLGVYGLQNGTVPIIPTYNITNWNMVSFLSRVEYSFKGKYLATATMRADGSSRFSKNDKWGYFPSAALAWRVSEEEFIRNIRAISNLKLRASIGQSGNTAIPSYLTLSTIATYFSPMNGNTPNFGVVVERPENTSLKWETTTQMNAGIDLGLFDDRISLTAEWYRKRTKDLLIEKVTPGYSGYRSSWTNLGSVQNSGVELSLNANLINKKMFNWSIDANIGFNRSRAIEIGPDFNIDPGVVPGVGTTAIIRNGEPIGQWYGYQTNGIWQSQAEILASGLTMINGQAINNIRPGTRRFIDQNGDHIINTADRVVLGEGQPKYTGGITNMIGYRQFGLNVVLQYSYGNKVYNANRVALEHGRSTNNMSKGVANSWRPSLYNMTTGELVEEGNPNNQYRMPGSPEELLMLSDWIEDGTFIRLSDITLTYNFSPKLFRKIRAEGAMLFISGKNLKVWTDYSGYDPEVNTRQGGYGDLLPSLDYASYPRSRFFSAGVKLLF